MQIHLAEWKVREMNNDCKRMEVGERFSMGNLGMLAVCERQVQWVMELLGEVLLS